jgi:hypothetical protein
MPKLERTSNVTHIDMHVARRDADKEAGRFTPATDLPEEASEVHVPAHIRERRETVKRSKERRRSNRRFAGQLIGGIAVLASIAALYGERTTSPEESSRAVPIQIQSDETVSDAIARYDRTVHADHKPDMGYVINQTNKVVERELGGNSLVHEGDVIKVDPDEG